MAFFRKETQAERERLIKTRYRLILANGSGSVGEVMWPRAPNLDRLRDLINPLLGGRLEHVAVLADFDEGSNFNRADMFVDDSGVEKELPRNDAATIIYRRATLCGRSAARIPNDPEELPAIYGPAVLFDRRVWF